MSARSGETLRWMTSPDIRAMLRAMFGMGMGELLLILVVALLVVGPDKLPDAAKAIGQGIRDLRKHTHDLQSTIEQDEQLGKAVRELRSALREDPLRQVRQALQAPVAPAPELKPSLPPPPPAAAEPTVVRSSGAGAPASSTDAQTISARPRVVPAANTVAKEPRAPEPPAAAAPEPPAVAAAPEPAPAPETGPAPSSGRDHG
jgi:Tat protein translocase TatB subunit